jgi:hypothetical protein
MNAHQKNRQNRGTRVKICVGRDEIKNVLVDIPGFTKAQTSLDVKLDGIVLLEQRQFTALKGLRAAIKSRRVILSPLCLQLSVALVALARFTGDSSLHDKVVCTETSLKNTTYAKLIVFAQTLLDLGVANKLQLVAYKILDSFYGMFETAIIDLQAAINEELTVRDQQKQVATEIEELLKETGEIVTDISVMVETLRESHPALYELYKVASHLGDVPTTTLSARGQVLDAETGEAIVKCRLRITSAQLLEVPPLDDEVDESEKKKTASGSPEFTKSVKLTSVHGIFRYSNLPSGTYVLTAFRAGYSELKATFYVNTGQCADVIIKLQKINTAAA